MKLFIITGQTATGKTKLAIELAKKYNGELISCDSRQVYKYLNVTTGKDLKKNSKFTLIQSVGNFDIGYYLLSSTKIWLYDVVDPKDYFSSFDFSYLAKNVINNIRKRKKTPIIVGGSFFYLKHLLYGVETENIPPNWSLRKELEKKSVEKLQQLLKKEDKKIFNQLNDSDRKNPRRLIRKLEIILFKKKQHNNLIDFSKENNWLNKNLEKKIIALKHKDKKNLIEKICRRVKERIKNQAIEEVNSLLKRGYQKENPGLKTIGCQQIIAYLEGKISKEEMINQWIKAEIDYARRQEVFIKKDKNVYWKEV